MENISLIKRPIITEKSLQDAQRSVFTFEVDMRANKREIKDSIEKIFNVHVERVTSVKVKGKKRKAGRKRLVVYQPDIKKARIKLAKGEKIDLFEIGEGK